MNLKKYITFLVFVLFISNPVFASKLPNDVWNFVKSQIPSAKQRFDSVITISDDVMYIPLYPPSDKTVDKISVEYSYPQKPAFAT